MGRNCYPYEGYISPDDTAFKEITNELVEIAGDNPTKEIQKYLKGTLSDIVYPVNGGL